MVLVHESWGHVQRVDCTQGAETIAQMLRETPSARVWVICAGGRRGWRFLRTDIVKRVQADPVLSKQLVRLNDDEIWLMPRPDAPQDVRKLDWLRPEIVCQDLFNIDWRAVARFKAGVSTFIPSESILLDMTPVVDAVAEN